MLLNLKQQKEAYLKLKELIILAGEAVKEENWEKTAQIMQAEAELKREIMDLSQKKGCVFSSPPPPLIKEALFNLTQIATETKNKVAEVLSLIEFYQKKGKTEKDRLQKARSTFRAYQRRASFSPRFIQKDT